MISRAQPRATQKNCNLKLPCPPPTSKPKLHSTIQSFGFQPAIIMPGLNIVINAATFALVAASAAFAVVVEGATVSARDAATCVVQGRPKSCNVREGIRVYVCARTYTRSIGVPVWHTHISIIDTVFKCMHGHARTHARRMHVRTGSACRARIIIVCMHTVHQAGCRAHIYACMHYSWVRRGRDAPVAVYSCALCSLQTLSINVVSRGARSRIMQPLARTRSLLT